MARPKSEKTRKIEEQILNMIEFLSPVEIANKVNISLCYLYQILRKNGKSVGRKTYINFIDDAHIKCSKCNEIKNISEFYKCNGRYNSYCKSCLDLQRNKNINSDKQKILKLKYRQVKNRANNSNKTFEISFEYFRDLYYKQEGKCFYTDVIMECSAGNGFDENSISVDRINNSLGYIEGNIVLCLRRVNTIKHNLTLDELQKWIPLWYDRLLKHLNK